MTNIENVPLSAALADIYSTIDGNIISEVDLLEWASIGFRGLKAKQIYEQTTSFIEVINHMAKLPAGIQMIEQIFYKDTFDKPDLDHILTYSSDSPEFIVTKQYNEFLESDYYGQNWKPLRLASSVFHNQVVIKDSPNYRARCEEEYSINKNNCVITSFEHGYLAVSYLRFPMKDGEFMIPDDIGIIKVIKNYVLMRMWEKRMNFKEEGAIGMFERYLRLWEITKAAVIGDIMLFSIDELENYKQQSLRIGSHTNTYYNGFGNLSKGEQIHFN